MGVGAGVGRGDGWRGITVSAVQILKPLVIHSLQTLGTQEATMHEKHLVIGFLLHSEELLFKEQSL